MTLILTIEKFALLPFNDFATVDTSKIALVLTLLTGLFTCQPPNSAVSDETQSDLYLYNFENKVVVAKISLSELERKTKMFRLCCQRSC